MEAEDQPFSEIQLGIRELFRIVVPGAYASVLFNVLPNATLPDALSSSTVRMAAAAFFLGLIGYALRPHECVWPYSSVFWSHVDDLNTAITGYAGAGDHTALYKYFLATGRRDVGHRIHYFSSFYYMLIALSFYSAVAALAEFFFPALRLARTADLGVAWLLALVLLGIAVAGQLSLLLLTGVMNQRRHALGLLRFIPSISIAAAVVAIGLNFAVYTGIWYLSATQTIWIVALSALAFMFANLANKQWRSIIREQLIHVGQFRDHLAKLR